MESFVLSETLKVCISMLRSNSWAMLVLTLQYLYLLFDDSPSRSPLSNAVFTTEGHSLSLPHNHQISPSPIRRALRRGEDQRCPAYSPTSLNGLKVGIEQRDDYDYARYLIYGPTLDEDTAEEKMYRDLNGRCSVPRVPKNVSPPHMFRLNPCSRVVLTSPSRLM